VAKAPGAGRQPILGWVERVATFFAEHYGLPPITGRVLGWLMICEVPEQSAGEIAAAIGASRASLTTAMRFLIASGLVHRLTRSGGRTSYYRIDDDMWETLMQRRIASMTSFSKITGEGLTLIGADRPRAARLADAHQFFTSMAVLLDEAMAAHKAKSGAPPAAASRARRRGG
jgi:DNA-binding transcriptional regulator GbsR (MarR family)